MTVFFWLKLSRVITHAIAPTQQILSNKQQCDKLLTLSIFEIYFPQNIGMRGLRQFFILRREL